LSIRSHGADASRDLHSFPTRRSSDLNGMYELGMIDPEITRAEVRDAAGEILGVIERARELGPRAVQKAVREIMDTFYTWPLILPDRKSTRLNSSHVKSSYAVFCLKKK